MVDATPDGYIQIRQASRLPDRPDLNSRILLRNIIAWSISDGCLRIRFSDHLDYYPLTAGFSFSIYHNSDGTCAQEEPVQ